MDAQVDIKDGQMKGVNEKNYIMFEKKSLFFLQFEKTMYLCSRVVPLWGGVKTYLLYFRSNYHPR